MRPGRDLKCKLICALQSKDSRQKVVDSLMSKSSKLRSLMKDLETNYQAEDVNVPEPYISNFECHAYRILSDIYMFSAAQACDGPGEGFEVPRGRICPRPGDPLSGQSRRTDREAPGLQQCAVSAAKSFKIKSFKYEGSL